MDKINKVLVLIFCCFFPVIIIVNILTPDRAFSEFENRSLAQLPNFTIKNLVDGNFTSNYEKYITEQFALRDKWVGFKAFTERLFGKKENNGVYFGKDGYLIEKFDKIDKEQIEKNTKNVSDFVTKASNINVYFMLIPNAAEVLKDKMPQYAPNVNQKDLISDIYSHMPKELKTIDVYSALVDNKDKEIYYKTDHHWTTKGAYFGYRELIAGMGYEPLEEGDFNIEPVSNDFYGTLYSKAAAKWHKPDRIDFYIPKENMDFKVTILDDGKKMNSLYEKSYLGKKDKYSAFLDGNNALTQIFSNSKNKSKVLVIKDSYAHSLVPFMANNFPEIHMADLRYLKTDLISYCKQNNINNIVIAYNVSNYCTDNNLVWLNAF